jgi:hypothetical protein
MKTEPKLTITSGLFGFIQWSGQNITFTFKNGLDLINFPEFLPWEISRFYIKQLRWHTFFDPLSWQLIIPVQPTEIYNWSWDQKDLLGYQCPRGIYRVDAFYYDSQYSNFNMCSSYFLII